MDTIGVIAEPDHPVFGRVGERLAARGFDVAFLRPGEPVDDAAIEMLDALVNGRLRRRSFRALRYADRVGVETWNGFVPTTALSCRLVALHALEAVGCRVPSIRFDDPVEGYVERGLYDWDGPVEQSVVYQERVRTDPVAVKYYAVDDGIETHVTALTVRSKLTGGELTVSDADVTVELATRVRELLDRFEARALAVEFVESESGYYAVDVDVAPTFVGTELDRRIADSMASLTTIGA